MAGLLISGVLALLPLLGIAYVIFSGGLFTVDGLFMSLILLTISGIFGLNILLELKRRRGQAKGEAAASQAAAAAVMPRVAAATAAPGSTLRESGVVEDVAFFEAQVGQPDKSLVTLRSLNGGHRKLIVFSGDLRNALPVGKRVKIAYAPGSEACQLVAIGD